MAHCILRWHTHVSNTFDSYDIVGPFPTKQAACDFGRDQQARNGDNPCWNYIYLARPDQAPLVLKPEHA